MFAAHDCNRFHFPPKSSSCIYLVLGNTANQTHMFAFFNAFALNILGLPGEKGERGSSGIGIRGQRGLPGPPGMSLCNPTPPQLNRAISLLIIARVCIHTCLFKAFSHSLSKTSWLMEPILIIFDVYLTTVISTLLFHITMFLILRLFRHDRWTLGQNDESLRLEWPVTQLLSLVFPNNQEQFFPWFVWIGWLKRVLTVLWQLGLREPYQLVSWSIYLNRPVAIFRQIIFHI